MRNIGSTDLTLRRPHADFHQKQPQRRPTAVGIEQQTHNRKEEKENKGPGTRKTPETTKQNEKQEKTEALVKKVNRYDCGSAARLCEQASGRRGTPKCQAQRCELAHRMCPRPCIIIFKLDPAATAT